MAQTDDLPPAPNLPVVDWRRRRRVMYAGLIFCAGVICYVLAKNMQGSVAETAVTMAFLTFGGIIGSYVFGATWQDISFMKSSSLARGAGYVRNSGVPTGAGGDQYLPRGG